MLADPQAQILSVWGSLGDLDISTKVKSFLVRLCRDPQACISRERAITPDRSKYGFGFQGSGFTIRSAYINQSHRKHTLTLCIMQHPEKP